MKKLLLILFVFGCENTITDTSDNPDSIDYGVVINEINYHSSENFDTEDWVELYNPNNITVQIGLWEFKDSGDNVFIFPENQEMPPESYLVLCKDLDAFSQLFPNVSNIIGGFEFGFNNAGEQIRLFDSDGLLVDIVEYNDTSPWPIASDGNGPTLELVDPSSDNSLGENWSSSNVNGGTPGEINSVIDEQY